MGCELRVFEPSNKIKACLMTAKGMIGVVLQVYSSDGSGTPSMIEVSVADVKVPRMFQSARMFWSADDPQLQGSVAKI